MIGRQVIEVNQAFTLKELEAFMTQHWDKAEYNEFFIGRPTKASIEEYILLPATNRYMVIVFPRAAGGIFNKKNKVVLSVCDTPAGAMGKLLTSIPTKNIFYAIRANSMNMSSEKERKGPAEEALQKYAAYMRWLLAANGFTK